MVRVTRFGPFGLLGSLGALSACVIDPNSYAASQAPTASQMDCSTDYEYDAAEVEAGANVGKVGAKVEASRELVRELDRTVERYLARWQTLCKEYNAGVLSKEEYRAEAARAREHMEHLEAMLIRLEKAPDSASYQAALSIGDLFRGRPLVTKGGEPDAAPEDAPAAESCESVVDHTVGLVEDEYGDSIFDARSKADFRTQLQEICMTRSTAADRECLTSAKTFSEAAERCGPASKGS